MNSTISHLPAQSVWIGVGLLAAAVLAVGLMWAQRRASSAAIGELMAVFGGSVVVAAVMSRVFWMVLEPSVDLGHLWQSPWLVLDPRQGGHSSFGAIVGGCVVTGVWLRNRLRRHSVSRTRAVQTFGALDSLAAGGLVGLALARLGCLANGCDFGAPAEVAWAVRHGPDTDAFRTHLERGWVGGDAAWSAPVHPFALYLAVGTLLIVAWAAWAISTRTFRAGRVAGWASGAYLLWRFATEWTRDEASVIHVWAGLNIHHILAVIGLAVLFVGLNWLDACGPKAAGSSSARNS
jgi:phosphatidylglycerol:prolipoprotein diacylglycerol transferase